MPTRRLKLVVAYRGTAYHGWQIQRDPTPGAAPDAGRPTVQQILRRALIDVVKHPLHVLGSSRTDAGVHAKGQVAHFDTDKTQIPLDNLRRAVNAHLPTDIVVRSVEAVPDDFHAISWAECKRYQYLVHATGTRDPFAGDLAWHRWQPIDVEAMQAAARHLVGTHDFASFARPGHGRASTVRTVHALTVARRGESVVIGVVGGGFLWNMVRILVGTLVDVAEGRRTPESMTDILAARHRQAAGGTAPAHGLYLQWVRTTGGLVDIATAPVGGEPDDEDLIS